MLQPERESLVIKSQSWICFQRCQKKYQEKKSKLSTEIDDQNFENESTFPNDVANFWDKIHDMKSNEKVEFVRSVWRPPKGYVFQKDPGSQKDTGT